MGLGEGDGKAIEEFTNSLVAVSSDSPNTSWVPPCFKCCGYQWEVREPAGGNDHVHT